MQLNVRDQSLRQLVITLNQVGGDFSPRVANSILLDAARPLLIAEQQEVPVGRVPQFQSGSVVRGKRKGQARTNQGTYARGGALRQSLRLITVNPVGSEDARVIVGASKAQGKAGWRAHFLINGTVKLSKNDYQSRAYSRTAEVINERVENSARVVINKRIKNLSK